MHWHIKNKRLVWKYWQEHIKSKTPSPSPYSPSSYLIPTGWNKIAQKIWQAFLIVMQVINSHKITRIFTPFTETNQHVKCLHLKLTFSPLIRYNYSRYFTILLMWWIQCSNLWSNGNLQSFSNKQKNKSFLWQINTTATESESLIYYDY